jgi:hypothetical protein
MSGIYHAQPLRGWTRPIPDACQGGTATPPPVGSPLKKRKGRSVTETKLEKPKPKRQRQRVFPIRLSEAEHAALKERAERAGLTVAGLIRLRCLDQPPPRASRRAPVDRAALAKILGQIGKVGGNIHQISRALNFKDPVTGDAVRAAIADFDSLRAAIMEALGRHGD